jgi:hypothetical protein
MVRRETRRSEAVSAVVSSSMVVLIAPDVGLWVSWFCMVSTPETGLDFCFRSIYGRGGIFFRPFTFFFFVDHSWQMTSAGACTLMTALSSIFRSIKSGRALTGWR